MFQALAGFVAGTFFGVFIMALMSIASEEGPWIRG